MPTIPTGELERRLRALYLRFIQGLQEDDPQIAQKLDEFQQQSQALIEKMGGRVAFMGALGDFPAPKLLELSPVAGVVYDEMKQAAIAAGISIGNGSKETARSMFRAGMDKSYRRLERLARTETTNAYWKNAFDSVADLPQIVMLWGSEDGPRTCPWCRERDGLVIDSSGLRDHPNGRCTPIPTLRSMVEYKGSVRSDGTIYRDPKWGAKPVNVPAPLEDIEPVLGKPTANPMQVDTFGSAVDPATRKKRIAAGDWRYIDDRDKRSVTLLQNDYRSEQAIKKAADNLRNGRPAMEGVGVPRGWSKEFTGTVTDLDKVRYTENQVRDAIEDAARWLTEQDTVKPRMLYKGLDVPKDKISKLFQVGSEFNTNFSSFTTDESVARGYSSRRASAQVIVRVRSAEAVKIQGNPTADHWKTTKEHLVSGKGRVTSVTEAHNGRTVYVDVEI